MGPLAFSRGEEGLPLVHILKCIMLYHRSPTHVRGNPFVAGKRSQPVVR